MSITGSEIQVQLPIYGTADVDNTNTLNALNAAIRASYPALNLREVAAAAVTLASQTYEYDLNALTLLTDKARILRVLLNDSSTEPREVRGGWSAHFDQSNDYWTLRVAEYLVDSHNGDTLDIEYMYPHPPITALADTIYLPGDYLSDYVCYWYAVRFISKGQDDRFNWRDLAALWREGYEDHLKQKSNVPPVRLSPRRGRL